MPKLFRYHRVQTMPYGCWWSWRLSAQPISTCGCDRRWISPNAACQYLSVRLMSSGTSLLYTILISPVP